MEIKVRSTMIQKLLHIDGDNNKCADCGAHTIAWGSCNLGVFVCDDCGNVHRNLGTHISNIKSVNGLWAGGEVLQMQGNRKARSYYEKHVPEWYRKPDHLAPGILREHWIVSKYLRKEFTEPNPALDYSSNATFEVQLKIMQFEKSNYRNVAFVISREYSSLRYYEDRRGRAIEDMQLVDLEVALAPDKMIHKNPMQLTYRKSATTRHMYVMGENPTQLMNLYMAIRCYKHAYLKATLPPWSEHTLASHMPCDFTKEGWLWKTGPRPWDKYRKRWFSLMKTKIMYHKGVMDSTPKGQFEICTTPGQICAELMDCIKIGFNTEVFPFTIRTTDRTYCVAAETNVIRREWIRTINSVVAVPLY